MTIYLALSRRKSSSNDLGLGVTTGLDLSTPVGGTDLIFGQPPIIAGVELSCDVLLPELLSDAVITTPVEIGCDVLLDECLPDCAVTYLIDVWRGPQYSPTFLHREGLDVAVHCGQPWLLNPSITARYLMPWLRLSTLSSRQKMAWETPGREEKSLETPWEYGESLARPIGIGYEYPGRAHVEVTTPWQTAQTLRTSAETGYSYPPRQQKTDRITWEEAAELRISAATPYDPSPEKRRISPRIPWENCVVVVSLWPRPDVWVPPPLPPRVITPNLDLLCATYLSDKTALPFGATCGIAGGTGIIPRLRTYIVIHDVDVIRLGDNYPIHASRVSLSFNADSWAWGFSATLLGHSALEAVLPDNGIPQVLAVSINGHNWHCIVDEWTDNRQFGQRSVSVKGRGLSAWLAAPYQLPGSGVSTSDMTLQQLLTAHLPTGEGWSVVTTADVPEWVIPAGAWSWSGKTSIQAIHDAATGMGLVVVPSKAARTLTIQPRYPVLPWHYATANPDLVVPDSAILSLSRQQAVTSQADAVFVHGDEVGGILARCYLQGTAGDRIAATAQSPLVTDIYAARLLGSRRLAAQAQQPEVRSITLPMGGVFDLGEVGDLLRAELDGSYHHGIINSVGVEAVMTATELTVRQTLTIGETTDNQYANFRRLLPSDPLLVGVVESSHSDGTVTVILTGGGAVRVKGASSVGQSVYVRSGFIAGSAPSLTAVDIEI